MADLALSLLVVASVLVGFGLGRLSAPRRRRVADELRKQPDPKTQYDLELTEEDLAWLEEVDMPKSLPQLGDDGLLRAAGFAIWSRPKTGEPRWQDKWPRRDVYVQSVALLIARDRLAVQAGRG